MQQAALSNRMALSDTQTETTVMQGMCLWVKLAGVSLCELLRGTSTNPLLACFRNPSTCLSWDAQAPPPLSSGLQLAETSAKSRRACILGEGASVAFPREESLRA
jgi:hypothetical protein